MKGRKEKFKISKKCKDEKQQVEGRIDLPLVANAVGLLLFLILSDLLVNTG